MYCQLNVKCILHELKCKLHVPCKLNVQECRMSNQNVCQNQKHYGQIKCNHPKGKPFNPKSMLATTLGSNIERVMLQFVRSEN